MYMNVCVCVFVYASAYMYVSVYMHLCTMPFDVYIVSACLDRYGYFQYRCIYISNNMLDS